MCTAQFQRVTWKFLEQRFLVTPITRVLPYMEKKGFVDVIISEEGLHIHTHARTHKNNVKMEVKVGVMWS